MNRCGGLARKLDFLNRNIIYGNWLIFILFLKLMDEEATKVKRYKAVVRVFVVSAVLVIVCTLSTEAYSVPITFNLRGPEIEDIDGAATMDVTRVGLTATLTANDGVLNRTANGFGINASGSGDDTDAIDNGSGVVESVSIMFDQLVTFDQLKLSLFTSAASDEASLTIADGPPIFLVDAGTTDIYNFSTDNIVSINQSVVLAYWSGNGFGFDEFTVTTSATAVPEPATVTILGIGLAGLGIGYLWRRRT